MARCLLVLSFALATLGLTAHEAVAQTKVGYVDSEYILSKTPEYATIQQQIDRMAQDWQQEVETRRDEVDQMFQEYQARELLYTNEERQQRRQEIVEAEEEVERLRMQYFGPEGQLFQEQQRLMRPIQERILTAVEEVAAEEGYDYVFDKGGDFLFLYAREQYNLSDKILQELGIDVESTQGGGN